MCRGMPFRPWGTCGAARDADLWDFCGARGGGRRRLTRPGIPEVRAVSAIGALLCLVHAGGSCEAPTVTIDARGLMVVRRGISLRRRGP